LNRKKGHDFLKLIKIKRLTAINGLLTLTSLFMLFFGLCDQVNESNQLVQTDQLIALTNSDNLIIFTAVIALVIFGFAFFAGWLKSSCKTRLLYDRT
jgi:preprotein translocase subunit SecE